MARFDPEHKTLLVAQWSSPMSSFSFPPASGCSPGAGFEGLIPIENLVDAGTLQVSATHAALEASTTTTSNTGASSNTTERNNIPVGAVGEFITVDQFHSSWKGLIKKYDAPSAFCGVLAPAYVQMLLNLLASGLMPSSLEQPHNPFAPTDTSLLLEIIKSSNESLCGTGPSSFQYQEVERIMALYSNWRKKWKAENPTRFTQSEAKKYVSAWIANYEISDILRGGHINLDNKTLMRHVVFLRGNQWPQYRVSKHEEKDRLVEEQRFGGRESDGAISFDESKGERSVVIELPYLAWETQKDDQKSSPNRSAGDPSGNGKHGEEQHPIDVDAEEDDEGDATPGPSPVKNERKQEADARKPPGPLLTPDEFSEHYAAEMPWPRIVVIDFLGHFATALCFKEEVPQGKANHLSPRTILFNTMMPGKANTHMLALAHYLFACSGPR